MFGFNFGYGHELILNTIEKAKQLIKNIIVGRNKFKFTCVSC